MRPPRSTTTGAPPEVALVTPNTYLTAVPACGTWGLARVALQSFQLL